MEVASYYDNERAYIPRYHGGNGDYSIFHVVESITSEGFISGDIWEVSNSIPRKGRPLVTFGKGESFFQPSSIPVHLI